MNLNSYIVYSEQKNKKNILNTTLNTSECACKNAVGSKESKESKESKGVKESKGSKESKESKEICSSEKVINLITDFIVEKYKVNNIEENKVIDLAIEKTKCDSESCVLTNNEFKEFVEKKNKYDIVSKELEISFKAKGPRDTTDLLNNINIDETLLRWSREYDHFYNCPFSMIDFKKIDNEFNKTNMANIVTGSKKHWDPVLKQSKEKCTTFACVLNTDISSGRGKHWICVFIDCRYDIWTIEFFNSSGNCPQKCIVEWMETQKHYLKQIHENVITVVVSQFVHQKSNTECGMYALFYIRSRLDDVPYTLFMKNVIEDDEVTEFRKYVFRCH
jgi:hypothetical protein